MVKFEHIVKDMVVVLKRDVHCTVIRTETSMTKRKGVKVTVFAKAVEGGEDVKEVKPAERLTELVSAPEGYVAGAVVEEKEEVAQASAERDDTVDTTSAGASLTVPIRAGEVKKGGFVLLKEKPCKVISVTTSKTGKHGHAKCNFTAIDIFTGKKLEDIVPSSHTAFVPNVTRIEYTLLDINDEDFMSLMDDGGDSREDLKMPTYPDDLGPDIRKKHEENEGGVIVTVMCSMGEEHVISAKLDASA